MFSLSRVCYTSTQLLLHQRWRSWGSRGSVRSPALPLSNTCPLTQAHLGNALDPLVSQLCILQPKQVQPFSLCVHLKGVLKAANTQTRIHPSSPALAPLTTTLYPCPCQVPSPDPREVDKQPWAAAS